MSGGDIALLILEVIGGGVVAIAILAWLVGKWVNATWGRP